MSNAGLAIEGREYSMRSPTGEMQGRASLCLGSESLFQNSEKA